MAKYDHGGGCACGLRKVCDCEHSSVPLTPKKEKPMASLELELDLGPMMRRGMITGLADMVDALPQYRYAVILELLRRDDTARVMITEALCEEARLVSQHEEAMQRSADDGLVDQGVVPPEQSYDDIAKRVIAELQDSPGGRAEV